MIQLLVNLSQETWQLDCENVRWYSLPRYRLPTEAEWEFAAYGLIGNTIDERIIEKRLYPWDGHWVRNPQENFQGDMLANFVRGREITYIWV